MKLRKQTAVTVLESVGDQWKVVEASVTSAGILIRRARILPKAVAGAEPAEPLPPLNDRADVILLANSDRSICRLMKIPPASAEDTRRMVALRLETELPYPVTDSLWACERLQGADPDRESPVLVLATPGEEIAECEKALGFTGRNPWAVQLDVAALAELALAAAPALRTLSPQDERAEDAVAICRVGDRATDLVIVRGRRLQYARRLFTGCPDALDADASRKLCDELDQCIHHYALDPDAAEPRRVIVIGERARAAGLTQALGRRIGLPAESMTLPPVVQIEGKAALDVALLSEFSACVGALVAFHRWRRGETTAAPALRRRKPPLFSSLPRRRAALSGVSLAVLAALIAVSFGVRSARIAEATRLVRKGQPFLQDMDRLQNEVDVLEYEERLQRPMLDILQALVETLPKTLKISTLGINPAGKVAITGVCNQAEEASDKAVAALRASKVFTNPRFLGASKQEQELRFRMTCELRGNPAGGTP